jgi:cysteine synthase
VCLVSLSLSLFRPQGNTGIALAALACAKGYKSVIVIPSSQSQEKKDALRHAGAQLVEVPPVPSASPNHYVKIGERLAKELGAFFAGQFDSAVNRQAHVESTGPEIYEQLAGNIDGFSCAIGTGGTLSGTAQYLREKTDGRVKIALTDPGGAKLVKWYNEGVLEAQGGSISEGIGQIRVTGAIGEDFKPDYAFQVPDAEAMQICFDLMKHEGISVGMSSGINVAGAMKLAEALGPGKTLVTILCDSADRYKGKMFDVTFLRQQGLPVPDWLVDPGLSEEVDAAVKRAIVTE